MVWNGISRVIVIVYGMVHEQQFPYDTYVGRQFEMRIDQLNRFKR